MLRFHKRPGAPRASGRSLWVAIALALSWGLSPSRVVAQRPVDPFAVSCQTVEARTSMADLRARHGQANVLDAPAASDPDDTPVTVLYPGSPERRAEIRWADGARTRMASFAVYGRKSAWHTPEGIVPGLAIADLELLNGRSFLLRHFEHAGGGYVFDWTGGKLARASMGDCSLVVRLMPPENQEFTTLEWRLVEAIASTAEVYSDERRIKPYKAAVVEIGLAWRK
jgi:hypothetical protein